MALRFAKAKVAQGPCGECHKKINAGDIYARVVRHATEKECNDVSVKTFRIKSKTGPMVKIKIHKECMLSS